MDFLWASDIPNTRKHPLPENTNNSTDTPNVSTINSDR